MRTVDIKSDLHKIVDRIESEQLLNTLYDFLKSREDQKNGELWNSLSEEQKKEVLLAYEESKDADNLINEERFFSRD